MAGNVRKGAGGFDDVLGLHFQEDIYRSADTEDWILGREGKRFDLRIANKRKLAAHNIAQYRANGENQALIYRRGWEDSAPLLHLPSHILQAH